MGYVVTGEVLISSRDLNTVPFRELGSWWAASPWGLGQRPGGRERPEFRRFGQSTLGIGVAPRFLNLRTTLNNVKQRAFGAVPECLYDFFDRLNPPKPFIT